MKILLVGSNFSYAIERYFVRYLTEMGATIEHFAAPDMIFAYHSKNLVNKILFHSKIYTGYSSVNKKLLKAAYSFKPDIIWVFKGMEIFPATLKKLGKDFKLANYNPDHPFLITSRGSGNRNVSESVGLYHLHFCYHNELMQRIEREFKIPTVFLPFSYDEEDVVYNEAADHEEIKKVCLQANPDAYRVNKVELLTKAGIEVDVYGIGWGKTRLSANEKVRIFDIVTRPKFWQLNRQYRLQLNLFREYNFGSHNMRSFEIPVVGGIQLTPYSEEQAGFFEEDKEIFFFRDDKEMVEQTRAILDMPADKIDTNRKAARKRSLAGGYSFKDRSQTVYNSFKAMMSW